MSQYSQMVGSFERTGNYPMEANYIFETYDDLVNFYSDEVQAATLHKGLLKIVEHDVDDKQALYWVVKKQTNDQLEFKCLITANGIQEIIERLDTLEAELQQEIEDRKTADTAIWGTENPELIDDELNSILDLANAITDFKQEYQEFVARTEEALENLLNICKAIVGTDTNSIIEYLNTLPYKNLKEVSNTLSTFLTTTDSENPNINTWPELESFLSGYKDSDTLQQLLEDLWNKIEGDPLPNEPFRTLRGTQDVIQALSSETRNRLDNLQTELDQTQIGVGLSGDGSYNADQETHYLKHATSVMNALKILDSLINEAINNCNLEVEDSNTVDLSINKYRERTVLEANVLISNESGNGIIVKQDGIYHKVSSEYENGVLTLKVNDTIVAQHVLGLSFVGIKRAYYDPATESIVMEFKKEDGTTEELRIPVTQLIREWVVDNSGVSDVVVLSRIEDFQGGPDKLSADVRIFADKYNILTKEGNTLYVRGTADNIVWNDVKVSTLLDGLQNDITAINQALVDITDELRSDKQTLQEAINNEVTRAKQAELEIRTDFEASQSVQDSKIDAVQTQANENSTAVRNLRNALDEEIVRATTEEIKNHELIVKEQSRAETKENALEDDINNLQTSVSRLTNQVDGEIARATEKEQELSNAINDEYLRATQKEVEIETTLTGEIARAKTAEQSLSERITVVSNRIAEAVDKSEQAMEGFLHLEAQVTAIDSKIDSETVRATAQESILAHSIQDEKQRAELVEAALREKVERNSSQYTELDSKVTNLETRVEGLEEDVVELQNKKADKSMLEWT